MRDVLFFPVSGWFKINAEEVCFGAKNDSYGIFNIQKMGKIFAFKLAHLSGGVSCFDDLDSTTKWGCGGSLNTHITNSSNFRLFPRNESDTSLGFDPNLFYKLPGFNCDSSAIEFRFFSSAIWVHTGQEFRIWYGEDLINKAEENNLLSKSCVDVYGFY